MNELIAVLCIGCLARRLDYLHDWQEKMERKIEFKLVPFCQ